MIHAHETSLHIGLNDSIHPLNKHLDNYIIPGGFWDCLGVVRDSGGLGDVLGGHVWEDWGAVLEGFWQDVEDVLAAKKTYDECKLCKKI